MKVQRVNYEGFTQIFPRQSVAMTATRTNELILFVIKVFCLNPYY